MSDIDFISRLPDQIAYTSGKDSVDFQKDRDGSFCIWTGDEHYDVVMSWESWVAFARKIIAADYAARVGGGI